MARTKTIEDDEFRQIAESEGGDVAKICEATGLGFPMVYLKMRSLGIKTKKQREMTELSEDDINLVRNFTSMDALTEELGTYTSQARFMLLKAVNKCWNAGKYSRFPRPRSPLEVRVFNVMFEMRKARDNGVAVIDDLDTVADMVWLHPDRIKPYHSRYMKLKAKRLAEKRKGRR